MTEITRLSKEYERIIKENVIVNQNYEKVKK